MSVGIKRKQPDTEKEQCVKSPFPLFLTVLLTKVANRSRAAFLTLSTKLLFKQQTAQLTLLHSKRSGRSPFRGREL